MPTSAEEFGTNLALLCQVLKTAKRNRASLSSHPFYSAKARSSLAKVRNSFVKLKRDYPSDRYPAVAFHLLSVESSLDNLIKIFPSSTEDMLQLAEEIAFKLESDLNAEIELQGVPTPSTSAPFIPEDLIEDRHFVLKKVLWEINRCYDFACYNACATMIRRLFENLIIEAFEHHSLSAAIKKNNEYVLFDDLIGKAAAEPKLRLTRNTKNLLPSLKFFGDIGAHNRNVLVRKQDIDRLHQAIRAGTEELVRQIG